ncbi:MAG: metal ABC transporter ATP-binding protein [Clostridiales bacterium]|jgi:zinc transport system ATP-binding protein|nr:metal ABC transporter ATP-binding protein [Clostridiales bacterium]
MPLITCKNASFGYEGSVVLSDVNFNVNSGDYLCIVGENGSGKSTLVKGMLGLKTPVAGTVKTGGGLMPDEIGYLPQQTAAQKNFPASVFEVVLSGRLNSSKRRPFYSKEDRRSALENLEAMGMPEYKDRCYHELSGGQQQRVLLARALCATKKLLLLDEPVTGLDPLAANELYRLVRGINSELGITVIMVSHDIHAAVKYASHILHLGNVQLFFGTTEDYLAGEHGRRFMGGETF